jgi:hypothetical protein
MTFTIDPEKLEAFPSETIQRLRADGKPTDIFLTVEEVTAVLRVGQDIEPTELETLFAFSPVRLAMLREILR